MRYQGTLLLQSNVSDDDRCYFSMMLMSPDSTDIVDQLPETIEVCPCNEENFAGFQVTNEEATVVNSATAFSVIAAGIAALFNSVY